MSPRYIRTPPEPRDEAAAALVSAALGLGVGLLAFYLVRLMLAREPLGEGERSGVALPRPWP